MKFDHVELAPTADFHVHLRDGPMMELCTPLISQGGVNVAYMMDVKARGYSPMTSPPRAHILKPNLVPPITTVSDALSYRDRLQPLAPDVKFLMTLYLHPSITPETIAEAARAGIVGVKAYPAGVTTNSKAGVLDWEVFYPVFEAMQKHDLVLNLHGEVPSSTSADEDVSIMNAEPLFLPTLLKIHAEFPKLRIVLEHCTTKKALEAVKSCGPTVAATITAHHLWITVDDVCGDVFNFCKPVAKTNVDRVALVRAVVEGNEKFFFGSDSAPHPLEAKKGAKKAAAGCFTQPWATQLVVAGIEKGIELGWIREEDVSIDKLNNFLSRYGRKFYRLPEADFGIQKVVIERKGEKISPIIRSEDGKIEMVPFMNGEDMLSLKWT